ncbi:MAG: DUF2190 family protein [Acholeplasmataceae bacterium]|jgi:predicted RecA/RadA family phage recombinase
MANVHQFLQKGQMLDYTPSGAAVTAGSLIQFGSLSGLCPHGIADGKLGSICVEGVIRAPFVGGLVGSVGDNVWWDANGTPYGGSADGACTLDATEGDWWIGTLVAATSATGATCDVALNKINPNLPAWQNRAHIKSAVDVTMVEATHSGAVIHITADAKTVTLPVGVVGMEYIVVNDVADGGALVTVDLNGTEICRGANLTIANGEVANNTKATAKRGDYLHLVCTVAATAWRCVEKRGIWAVA